MAAFVDNPLSLALGDGDARAVLADGGGSGDGGDGGEGGEAGSGGWAARALARVVPSAVANALDAVREAVASAPVLTAADAVRTPRPWREFAHGDIGDSRAAQERERRTRAERERCRGRGGRRSVRHGDEHAWWALDWGNGAYAVPVGGFAALTQRVECNMLWYMGNYGKHAHIHSRAIAHVCIADSTCRRDLHYSSARPRTGRCATACPLASRSFFCSCASLFASDE